MKLNFLPAAFILRRFALFSLIACSMLRLILAAPQSEANQREILRVLSFYDPFSLSAHEQVFAFEAANQCWVQWEFRYEYEIAEMTAEDFKSFDVITVDEPRLPSLCQALIPLTEWSEGAYDRRLPSSLQPIAESTAQWDEIAYGVPILMNFYLHVYREDWFGSVSIQNALGYGSEELLKPPDSIADLLLLNERILQHGLGQGFAPITRYSEGMVVDFLIFLRAAGIRLETVQDLRYIDTDRLAEVITEYCNFLNLHPVGADDWFVEEINTAYVRGEVPQIFQWWSLTPSLKDPLYAKAGTSTSFRELPGAVSGSGGSVTGVWLLSIPKTARPKLELAVEFIDWWHEQSAAILNEESDTLPGKAIEHAWSRPKLLLYDRFSKLILETIQAAKHEASGKLADELTQGLKTLAEDEMEARAQLTVVNKQSN